MRFPKLNRLRTSVDIRTAFGGYDHTEKVSDGEFYDCENICSDKFPLLSVRSPRGIWNAVQRDEAGNITGFDGLRLFVNEGVTAAANVSDKLVLCAANDIIYDGRHLDVSLASKVKNRAIVPFGKNFFVIPDAKYVMPEDDGSVKIKHVANRFRAKSDVVVDCCYDDGSFPECGIWLSLPHIPEPGDVLATVTQDGVFASVYDRNTGEWIMTKRRICSRFSAPGIDAGFECGDTVYLEEFSESALNGCFTVVKTEKDRLIVATPAVFTYTDRRAVCIEKRDVLLDYAVEHNNRIWGCRYGKNENGIFVNEIYASAPGDPTVWRRYDGISTDSYCATLGCSGEFTGACVAGGDVLFFKEDYVIKVSGDVPADFIVSVFPIQGVETGAFRSIVNINDRVFYKSRLGVTVYDGVTARNISDALGEIHFSDVCAGTVEGKYFFAATDPAGKRKIYVYDILHRIWHKEDDNRNTEFFVYRKNCLYSVCRMSKFNIGTIPAFFYCFTIHDSSLSPDACSIFTGDDGGADFRYTSEPDVEWFAESGYIGVNAPQSLILRKLNIGVELPSDATFAVDIKCDGDKQWRRAFFSDREFSGALTVPVNLPKCTSLKIKFSGTGGCVIKSVVRIYEKTSGVNMLGG